MWAFWSLHSLTSRVCPVKSLPQNSHLARRWGHVYLRWSSIRTRGICAPHLLVQGIASCLHVLRWACQKKPIFSVTALGQCHDSLASGGIIQRLLSGYRAVRHPVWRNRKIIWQLALFYSQYAVTHLTCWLSSFSYLILLNEIYLPYVWISEESVTCKCVLFLCEYCVLFHARMLPYAKHQHFPLCVWPLAFQNKRRNFCPVVRGAWNFILAVRYEIRTRCGHSAHMLCYSLPDRQTKTKWVFSDAVSCSDDMGRGDLHYRSITIYGQV